MNWTTSKPIKPGWYWWRGDSAATGGAIVHVQPQYDTVGPSGDGSTSRLSIEKGEWAGPLEVPR